VIGDLLARARMAGQVTYHLMAPAGVARAISLRHGVVVASVQPVGRDGVQSTS
jgi:hypothetical protein